ncbi:MAG: hypothetical protein ABIP28_08910, partial [Mucilaginibacter sp.]
MSWLLYEKKLNFVFDGIDLECFYPNQSYKDRYFTIKSYLDYFKAEDITGIELMYNQRYNSSYGIKLLPVPFGSPPRYDAYAWIEITTCSKQGP